MFPEKKVYILGLSLFLVVFASVGFLVHAPFRVGNMTCQQYEKRLMDAKNNSWEKPIWSWQVRRFWTAQKNKFKKDYPDISESSYANKKVKNWLDSIAMYKHIERSCSKEMGLNEKMPLSQKVQDFFHYAYSFQMQKKLAQKADCEVWEGHPAPTFGLRGPDINICADKHSSVEIGVSRAAFSEGAPNGGLSDYKSIRFCPDFNQNIVIRNNYSEGQKKPGCIYIEATKEQQCLSEYGICQKQKNGKCGWSSTEKSLDCMGREF